MSLYMCCLLRAFSNDRWQLNHQLLQLFRAVLALPPMPASWSPIPNHSLAEILADWFLQEIPMQQALLRPLLLGKTLAQSMHTSHNFKVMCACFYALLLL